MVGLDTNVIIRYITQDDPDQSKIATAFIEQYCTVDNPGYINQIVLCEIVWVLKGAYRYDKKVIIEVLHKLQMAREIIVENADNVRKATEAYTSGNADFSDYLIALSNHQQGCSHTVSFDKNFTTSDFAEIL